MRKDIALEKYFFSVLRNMGNKHLVKVKANAFSEAYSEPNQASQIEVLVKKAFSRLLFLTKISFLNVMRCAIWYYLYNLKTVKNTHGWVLNLAKFQAEACNFTKINTPPWVLFTFFKLNKWYQIAQRTTNFWLGAECASAFWLFPSLIYSLF